MARNISHTYLPAELFIYLGQYAAPRAKLSGRGGKGTFRFSLRWSGARRLYCACVNVKPAFEIPSQVVPAMPVHRPDFEKEGLRGPPSSTGQSPWGMP